MTALNRRSFLRDAALATTALSAAFRISVRSAWSAAHMAAEAPKQAPESD